jgi:hypothetical protein
MELIRIAQVRRINEAGTDDASPARRSAGIGEISRAGLLDVISGCWYLHLSLLCAQWECSQNHLFLEQAEGYVEAPEKSTSPRSTMKEIFEHCARS